jgi:hypothetical protein
MCFAIFFFINFFSKKWKINFFSYSWYLYATGSYIHNIYSVRDRERKYEEDDRMEKESLINNQEICYTITIIENLNYYNKYIIVCNMRIRAAE